METRMKKIYALINGKMTPSTVKDLSLLAVCMVFVFSTMPVTIMGDENVAQYFFAERNIKSIQSVNNCLSPYQPCTVELDTGRYLSVTMPTLVSITDHFDVSAQIKGVKAERVTVTFKGVGHSHGLLPQTMLETKTNDFQVKGILSYCGYKKMNWLAYVTVFTERTTYEATFNFESVDSRVAL